MVSRIVCGPGVAAMIWLSYEPRRAGPSAKQPSRPQGESFSEALTLQSVWQAREAGLDTADAVVDAYGLHPIRAVEELVPSPQGLGGVPALVLDVAQAVEAFVTTIHPMSWINWLVAANSSRPTGSVYLPSSQRWTSIVS